MLAVATNFFPTLFDMSKAQSNSADVLTLSLSPYHKIQARTQGHRESVCYPEIEYIPSITKLPPQKNLAVSNQFDLIYGQVSKRI